MSKGKLIIRLKSASWLLRDNLPIEIRDSHRRLIKKIKGSKTLSLDPGLYSVSAVLDDGELHHQLVQVRMGDSETVELISKRPQTPPHDAYEEAVADNAGGGPFDTTTLWRSEKAVGADATLEHVEGAKLKRSKDGRWIFIPDGVTKKVPTACILTEKYKYEVSLPINPLGDFPENSCEVKVTPGRRGALVSVRLAPERTVASTIERMVESGYVKHSTAIATEANELLFHKYRDPVGAALGGLLLHRHGRLETRGSWVKNLSNSFSWLPDGQILYAGLLAKSDCNEEQEEGLQLLLDAAQRRMMFADGLSLALELLRRWPSPSRRLERNQILNKISRVSAGAQWRNIVLIVRSIR